MRDQPHWIGIGCLVVLHMVSGQEGESALQAGPELWCPKVVMMADPNSGCRASRWQTKLL